MKQYGDAVRAYNRVQGAERDYALFQIGKAYANSERSTQAVAAFEELRVKHPFSQWREEASYQIAYLKFLDDEHIVMSITPSNRGEGWELLRLGDHRIVDFRTIAENPEVSFVHANGFLAKTRTRLPLEEVVLLASMAIA